MSDLAISLVIAGIGSLITWAAARLSRNVRNHRLRKRYPVAGRFLTTYEDSDRASGEVDVRKAITKLEQKGREVSGKTEDLNGGRTWLLKGRIEPGGFLNGVYTAEDPNDPGKGTFFLDIERAGGDMRGLWAGFDSEDDKIDSGRYEFTRCPDATIQFASDGDAASVCALLGDALGELYVDIDTIRSTITADNVDATCLIAVGTEGDIIGAITAAMCSADTVRDLLPAGQEETLERISRMRFHERFCLIRAVAVVPRWRGGGIASQLVHDVLDWCRSRGSTAAISFGWKSSKGCHIEGVMEITGFDDVLEIPKFWDQDSQLKQYDCPECKGRCECAAVVFMRSIDTKAAIARSTA